MTIEMLQAICEQFPGMTQDIKWEDHLCFNVGEKMFLITSPGSVPHTASFKASDEAFEELCTREGFKPAAYLARYKWVYTDNINRLTRKEWEKYLYDAYMLIFNKLPARKRQQIKAG